MAEDGSTMDAREDEDPWAPLSPEQLAKRPGEEHEAAPDSAPRSAAQPGRAKPVCAMPAAPKVRAPNEQGEKLLRALQDRIANAGPGDSLIAEVQNRERRAASKSKKAERASADLGSHLVKGTLPPPPAPVLEVHAASDLDPRELESWFLELPEAERKRLRATWHGERHRFDDAGAKSRARILRAAAHSSLVFCASALVMGFLMWSSTVLVLLIVIGPMVGAVAQLLGGGRFTFALVGLFGFCLGMLGGSLSPLCMYGALLTTFAMAAVGMDGEMRRSGGCED